MKSIRPRQLIVLSALIGCSTLIYSFVMSEKPSSCGPADHPSACSLPSGAQTEGDFEIQRSDAEWRAMLTPQQYHVMRAHGTEPPFRNAYHDHKEPGLYVLAGTQIPLFSSAHKYNSGTGWPSFWDSVAPENVGSTVDHSHGMTRTEVHCALDGSHLGHVFEDGPAPTGLRYCINSAALDFIHADELEAKGLAGYHPDKFR